MLNQAMYFNSMSDPDVRSCALMYRLFSFSCALLASGCATLITGTNDTVHLTSHPPGATVEIQGQVTTTPVTLVLSRSYMGAGGGRASLEGYLDRPFEIPRSFNMWAIGNVVTLFLGLYVDVLTGAISTYPDTHEFRMYPNDGEPGS